MINNEKLLKLKDLANSNMDKLNKISEELAATEECFKTLTIINLPVITKTKDDMSLSYEKFSKRNKRIIATYKIADGETKKRPAVELPIDLRFKAHALLGDLIEEIYNNQKNVINIDKRRIING